MAAEDEAHRGIPEAAFIEDVAGYMAKEKKSAQAVIAEFDGIYQKVGPILHSIPILPPALPSSPGATAAVAAPPCGAAQQGHPPPSRARAPPRPLAPTAAVQYKMMENSLLQKKAKLRGQLTEIRSTLTMLKHLAAREDGAEAMVTDFRLADAVYAKAKIPDVSKVSLWLGVRRPLPLSLPPPAASPASSASGERHVGI